MTTPTYPGVYIEEVPGGVPPIVGVSTSVTGFVGAFQRGPIDVAMQIFSVGDLDRTFGRPHRMDETGAAVRQAIRNGLRTAYVVRTASGDYRPARSTIRGGSGAGVDVLAVTAGRQHRGRSVDDPGIWGNALRLQVDYDTRDPNDADLFNLIVTEVESSDGRRNPVREEVHANLSVRAASPDYAVDKVNGASVLVQLESAAGPGSDLPARPAQSGTTGGELDLVGGLVTPPIANGDTLNVEVLSSTLALGPTQVELDGLPSAVTPVAAARALERALQTVGRNNSNPVLAGARVQVVAGALRVTAGGSRSADFDPEAQITFSEDGGTTAATLKLAPADISNTQEHRLGSPTPGLPFLVATPPTQMADDGGLPDATALIGDFGRKTGMYALRDVDLFNLLVIPGAVAPHMTDTQTAAVYAAAVDFCEEERAFLIADTPPNVSGVVQVRDWVAATLPPRRNAAVYYPRLQIPDPEAGMRLRSVGASGTVAGVYARTDGERGVWKAPAGLDASMRNVQRLDDVLTDSEIGQLNPVGINCCKRHPAAGTVVWGSRTRRGSDLLADEHKYVPVRRFTLFLEETIYRYAQKFVFEPNDEPLWSQIRISIGAFMQDLFRQGAFQGTTPRQSYFVKCDAETTTQYDIDRGIVNIVVGFAPLKPAEFVIVKIQQLAGQTQI